VNKLKRINSCSLRTRPNDKRSCRSDDSLILSQGIRRGGLATVQELRMDGEFEGPWGESVRFFRIRNDLVLRT
jgi:hypothetical protein